MIGRVGVSRSDSLVLAFFLTGSHVDLVDQPDIDIGSDEKEPITTLSIDGLPVGRRIAGSISEHDWEAELRPQLEAELRESTERTNAHHTSR